MRVWNTNLRFNLDDTVYGKAYENLKNMDRKSYMSICRVIAVAVNEYFDRQKKLDRDPYLETRQRENEFCDAIVNKVGESLEKAMPVFMSAYLLRNAGIADVSAIKESPAVSDAHDDEDYIDLDFAGQYILCCIPEV